jgi:hypothetical protein
MDRMLNTELQETSTSQGPGDQCLGLLLDQRQLALASKIAWLCVSAGHEEARNGPSHREALVVAQCEGKGSLHTSDAETRLPTQNAGHPAVDWLLRHP